MRIGIDVRAGVHEPAGIGMLTLNLVKELMKADRENHYVMYSDAPLGVPTPDGRFQLALTSFGGSQTGNALWHPYVAFDARYRRRLDRFISIGSLQISALTKKFSILVIPDLSHILMPEFHVAKARLTAKMLMKRGLVNARHIVAISHHTKSDILRYMNGRIEDDKVSVAHIACDEIYSRTPSADDRTRVKGTYRLPEKFVLSVGTLEPRKNYETLIRAFRECVDAGLTHNLVVVGRKGWLYESIFAETKTLGLERRVHFLGFVPLNDMPSIYAMADAFVYPSLYEGFGIPPLEAMSCGVPVITSNVASLPEVTGDAAILIDPHSVRELSSQLSRILGDESLRRTHGAAGLKQARKFSWRSFAENVLLTLLQ